MAQRKCTLYVGGLSPEVSEELLHATFIPFGDIKSIQIPKDFSENKSRGFGFVEYETDEDCAAALENMHGSELFGKVLRCAIAKPMANKTPGAAIWTAEDWIKKDMNDEFDDTDNIEPAASLRPT